MKISYAWLKDFIEINESPEDLAEILTQTGLEVEGLEKKEKIPGGLAGIVIGEIMTCEQHQNADKLKVTKVDIGAEELSDIVCGAPNVAAGQKVLVATVNSTISPTTGEPFKIKKAKIRGEVSAGMLCAEDELGLGESHDGIMVLDTELANGTPAIELFDNQIDPIFEIGLTPNRGDATSHLGTARDIKAFFKREITLPSIESIKVGKDSPITISIENEEACPRYSGLYLENVTVAASPEWLQWKLRSIGLEPINNIVDITNFVLHAVGQPMHAFDADKIQNQEIRVKTLPSNTLFSTLDEKERKLHERDLMICDGEDAGLCIAGVFGGLQSGVKEHTTAIFLESAYFAADYVRATAQRHTLSTDASFRYERGTDPEITVFALQMAAKLIKEIAGGTIVGDIIDKYPSPINPVKIKASFYDFERLIGKKIPNEEITGILNRLAIKTEEITDENFTAIVPPFRSDVTRVADLIEEVLRIYGFNEIELDDDASADFLASFKEHEPYKIQEELSKFLAGAGFHEILTNSLTNPDYFKKNPIGGEPVTMLNPSSSDLAIMKTSPVYTALESIAFNINRKSPNLKFFEFGRTYKKESGKYKETEWLSCYLTGNTLEENWLHKPEKTVLQDLLTYVTSMLTFAGIRKLEIVPSEKHIMYEYGMVIKQGGKMLGLMGSLKPEILEMYGIKEPVFQAQLDWATIMNSYHADISFEKIPKFPEVKRDLSLVLNKSVSYAEIEKLAFEKERKLLTRINLFSVFEGDKIGKDKKAYAISFFLQDKFKTLTDKQIDKSMNGLMNAFEKDLQAVIRR